jgi:hypothetical protein
VKNKWECLTNAKMKIKMKCAKREKLEEVLAISIRSLNSKNVISTNEVIERKAKETGQKMRTV